MSWIRPGSLSTCCRVALEGLVGAARRLLRDRGLFDSRQHGRKKRVAKDAHMHSMRKEEHDWQGPCSVNNLHLIFPD